MKATGMIRRVDDLGRVVIPIEIRRLISKSTDYSLEFFIDDSSILLRKYKPTNSTINDFQENSTYLISAIHSILNKPLLYCDNSGYIKSKNISKSEVKRLKKNWFEGNFSEKINNYDYSYIIEIEKQNSFIVLYSEEPFSKLEEDYLEKMKEVLVKIFRQ